MTYGMSNFNNGFAARIMGKRKVDDGGLSGLAQTEFRKGWEAAGELESLRVPECEPSNHRTSAPKSSDLCTATIRACIEALPKPVSGNAVSYDNGYFNAITAAKVALHDLLPKPVDPVKGLVEEFQKYRESVHVEVFTELDAATVMARWLHSTGRLKEVEG